MSTSDKFKQKDTLEDIFDKRLSFMKLIEKKFPNTYPDLETRNLDLSNKLFQNMCREVALKGVEEMFEALGHLKNWKPHRETDVPEFDREEFLEEIVDAFNYFLSLLILIGVDDKEFIEAFNKKDKIIRNRVKSGY